MPPRDRITGFCEDCNHKWWYVPRKNTCPDCGGTIQPKEEEDNGDS